MKVFFKFNGPEQEIKFVRWTKHFLVLQYPPGSLRAGEDWKIGKKTVQEWLANGVLRFEP